MLTQNFKCILFKQIRDDASQIHILAQNSWGFPTAYRNIPCFSFIADPQPANATEKQLTDLMENYRMDAGTGFHPTTQNLFNALSASFPLLCIFGCLVNFYLLRKKVDLGVLKGIVNINILVFGACFVIMSCLTFLPPIICTALIVLSLLLARLSFPQKAS